MRADVPVSWMSTGGWFLGHTVGTGTRNVAVREAQFRVAGNERRRMAFSRELVAAKIRNTRTMLRRNWRPDRPADDRDRVLASLRRVADHARAAPDEPRLLGYEGEAAATYFLITYRVPWKGTVPQRVRIPPGKLSLQPVAIGADDGGNDIVRSTSV